MNALASAPLAPMVSTALSSAPNDAELLRLGTLFDAAYAFEKRCDAEARAGGETEAAESRWDQANDATLAIVEQLIALPASTIPGLLVKARVLAWLRAGAAIEPATLGVGDASSDLFLLAGIATDLIALGNHTTGAPTPSPDAALMAMISRFELYRARHSAEFDALNKLPKRHPDYARRWAAWRVESNHYIALEKEIVFTRALTTEGATAKARLGVEMLEAGKPVEDDQPGPVPIWSLATSGLRDLLAVGMGDDLGADDALLALHADLRQAAMKLRLHAEDNPEDRPGYDPDVDDATNNLLAASVSALVERILAIPAHTLPGRQCRASAASYKLRLALGGHDPAKTMPVLQVIDDLVGPAFVDFTQVTA